MERPSGGRAQGAPTAAPQSSAPAAPAPDPRQCELSRLFIVCGRGRKLDELRALFSTCGAIKHLHLALDRSKKSRGFAFLQYEDPANAAVAIKKLDRMKLDDGHILKVTIAKEKPVGANGKLKRDQHARQDEKTDGAGRDDGGIVPGKRQRSSPPAAALPLGPVMSPAFRLGGISTNLGLVKQELPAKKLPSVRRDWMGPDVVLDVLRDMVSAVEQHAVQEHPNDDVFSTYQRALGTTRSKMKPKRGNLMVVVPETRKADDELSTESLASSIRSVSLASTPLTLRGSPLDSLPTPRVASADQELAPPFRSNKHHLRRRRQSLDDSSSSTDGGSDGSGVRRKRSNTTTSPPTLKSRARVTRSLLSPPRKFSDRSDMSLSPEALKAEIIAKKQCKRQSSDSAIEGSYRLAKQQATRSQDDETLGQGPVRHHLFDTKNYGNSEIKLEFKAEPPRTKLFFTSTYKFTVQELEAMFAVYGDFESVELVKSFGRVKTMAYVHYSNPTTAASVVQSFREESSQGENDPEQSEFMALSFAHGSGETQTASHKRAKQASIFSDRHPSEAVLSTVAKPSGKDRLWVLLLYDRFLATHMLSSVVSSFSGMEFMDIKVVKSTGEAQGVAFVKFDSEQAATEAALQLHQMELPLGSGKYLQAIVILAPSLFTTTHGSNAIANNESMRLDRSAGDRVVTGSSEDVDLRAVEARFAHLMRSNEHHPWEGYLPPMPPSAAVPSHMERQLSPMPAEAYPPPPSSGFHAPMGLSAGLEYYPMQLVSYPQQQQFQPYTAFGGPPNYQQQQAFGGGIAGWMDSSPYYQTGAAQYPFPCAQQEVPTFPVASIGPGSAVVSSNETYTASPKPRSSRSSSEQMDTEDGSSSCSSQASACIHVSTDEPLQLVTLVGVLQDCAGVMAFSKDTNGEALTSYTVDFAKEAQALDAARKLDGTLCGGQKLRVAKSATARHRGGGGKTRIGSGRRKRQRVDPRSRK